LLKPYIICTAINQLSIKSCDGFLIDPGPNLSSEATPVRKASVTPSEL
jgi:hypothetical protein